MNEHVLLVVHKGVAEKWASRKILSVTPRDAAAAQQLLAKLAEETPRRSRIIEFEVDPWLTDAELRERNFSWDAFADGIGRNSTVDLAGLRRTVCVRKVHEKLRERGIQAEVMADLTID